MHFRKKIIYPYHLFFVRFGYQLTKFLIFVFIEDMTENQENYDSISKYFIE